MCDLQPLCSTELSHISRLKALYFRMWPCACFQFSLMQIEDLRKEASAGFRQENIGLFCCNLGG